MSPYDRGIRRVATAGVLLAITLLLVFTRIGMFPVPTPAGNATIAHIPAIIGGVLEGPLVGLLVGMGFGFASFANATIPMFKDPMVAIVPRLFIGITASWVFMAMRKASKPVLGGLLVVLLAFMLLFSWQMAKTVLWLGIVWGVLSLAGAGLLAWWMRREDVQVVVLGIAAAVGSLTNTVLVLSTAVMRGYIPKEAAWGIGLTHGIPEVIVAGIVTVAVVSALRQVGGRRRRARL
jgi:uncharacterized membrane protein